mmetsp:Transcript_2845/g.4131  ORF Transcript_2845/g.4131 Transcript_2845/m.4131 type:complete len:196 (+) Transcript_2845:187-774(+)
MKSTAFFVSFLFLFLKEWQIVYGDSSTQESLSWSFRTDCNIDLTSASHQAFNEAKEEYGSCVLRAFNSFAAYRGFKVRMNTVSGGPWVDSRGRLAVRIDGVIIVRLRRPYRSNPFKDNNHHQSPIPDYFRRNLRGEANDEKDDEFQRELEVTSEEFKALFEGSLEQCLGGGRQAAYFSAVFDRQPLSCTGRKIYK